MTTIKFKGEHKTTLMNMVAYLLSKEGHAVDRTEEKHTLEVLLVIQSARCFAGEIADQFKD